MTEAELDAFFVSAGDDDGLQADGLQVIGDRRLEFARDRIDAALRAGGPKAMDGAVRALNWLEGDDFGGSGKSSAESILLALIKDLPAARAARLAILIVNLEFGPRKKTLVGRVVAAAGASKIAVQIALADSLNVNDETLIQMFHQLPAGEAEGLIADGPRPLARRLLMISAAEGLDVTSTAEAWAAHDDTHDARAAIRALSFLQTDKADDVIEKALEHDDFEVRRQAIEVLAPRAEGLRRQRLLNMASNGSAPVRAALAKVIGENLPAETVEHIIAILDGRPTGPVHLIPFERRPSLISTGGSSTKTKSLVAFQNFDGWVTSHSGGSLPAFLLHRMHCYLLLAALVDLALAEVGRQLESAPSSFAVCDERPSVCGLPVTCLR